jgi:hypothetical protein
MMSDTQPRAGERGPGNYFEQTKVSGIQNIARDIAHRLHMRHRLGGTEYIITQRPHELMILIQKHWHKMMRQALAKRAATDDSNTEKLVELSRQITYMQNLQFAESPWEAPEARVFVITPEAAAGFPPDCCAIYMTAPVNEELFKKITSNMQATRLVVQYGPLVQP